MTPALHSTALPIPAIYTNQQLINAFHYVAEGLGVEDYRTLLSAAGQDLDALAADRSARYAGTPIEALANLSDAQKASLRRELLGELLKDVRWVGIVNAPDGLNLRPSPSIHEQPLALLDHETLLQVLDDAGEWLFVAADGNVGYVYAAHVLRRLPSPVEPLSPDPRPEIEDAALPAAEQVSIPPGSDPTTIMVAGVWNRYGGALRAEAQRLGIDPAVAAALLAAESNGHGFGPDGRLLIRFENHIFYDQWGKHNQAQFFACFAFDTAEQWSGHRWRPDAGAAWQDVHPGSQAAEWQVFTFARQLDETAALLSISMGIAQIMGFNYSLVGFAGVQDMFRTYQGSIAAQISGFFNFVKARRLVDAVRNGELRTFAAGYNGPGRADAYSAILRNYLSALAALLAQAVPSAATAAAAASGETPNPVAAPMPPSPVPGVPLSEADPALYAAWQTHIKEGFANNQLMFERVLKAFMNPYWLTVITYGVLLVIGIGGFLVAAILGMRDAQWPVTAVFGGLSIAAFLTFFLNRPLQALEENLQFITWLGVVYNTYWTRLANAQNADTFQADMDSATSEFVQQIQQLISVHGERSGKRPNLPQS
jgi:hypothetical protein